MSEPGLSAEQVAQVNEAFFAALAGPEAAEAAAAASEYTRRKLNYIEHVPLRYFLPDAEPGQLARLYRELAERGQIKLSAVRDELGGRVPECLLPESAESEVVDE